MKIKALLYCTKSRPYLYKSLSRKGIYITEKSKLDGKMRGNELNGRIIAECDFEVEEIEYEEMLVDIFDENEEIVGIDIDKEYYTKTLYQIDLQDKSCLSFVELDNYLKGKNGYAIHIKNLHIFDTPKELSEFGKYDFEFANPFKKWQDNYIKIEKAPQNMMICTDMRTNCDYILISIRPEWLCKILNGEKDVEVRKKVLKEMLKNEEIYCKT